MNSALKPILPQAGVQPAGQASPAKGNVANANHAVGLPQGAQNSLHHGSNNLVGQNLTHHAPAAPQIPPHPVPSMAPVSANMAQMAQNMSHHGNLSHVTQNSVAPTITASPNKSATTSTPLSLVADKPSGPVMPPQPLVVPPQPLVVSPQPLVIPPQPLIIPPQPLVVPPQPLALTRTPEKKEPDSTGQSNGTVESPKSASNAPAALKPQNPEPNKEKQDISKTSPSTPKPPEKPVSAPSTPQKAELVANSAQLASSAQPKMVTANEAPEKSPAKPSEPKPAPAVAADVPPTKSDNKPAPESANDNKAQNTAAVPPKAEPASAENAKTENTIKPKEKKEELSEKPVPAPAPATVKDKKEEVKVAKAETPKKVEAAVPQEKPQKVEEKDKPEEKKPESKPAVAVKEPRVAPRSTMKLATVTTPMRKRRQASPKASEGPSSVKKLAEADSTPDSRTKRNRTQVQLYQSPTPELTMATKLSASAGRSTPTKQNDDKLIVFYKNEYLAVRNAEGSFYVCQAMQNVYRTTRKIKIRWLSQDKSADPSGETFKPDFYDVTDMECVLTTLSLTKAPSGGGSQILSKLEEARARSILERAIKAEHGGNVELTEEHPDGLDLSLYKDESQLDKKARKRGAKTSPRKSDTADEAAEATPAKRAREPPKRSPPSARKPQPQPQTQTQPQPHTPKQNNNKRKPAGSKPTVASTSKTATAVSEKAKTKSSPALAKRTPVKSKEKETPVPIPVTPVTARGGRRSAGSVKEVKPSPAPAPTPSTSSGKTSRRKPPQRK